MSVVSLRLGEKLCFNLSHLGELLGSDANVQLPRGGEPVDFLLEEWTRHLQDFIDIVEKRPTHKMPAPSVASEEGGNDAKT